MTYTLSEGDFGIPRVLASSPWALAYGHGVVTAHHRAWQLDLDHRRATGRLAEVWGEASVEEDVFARRTDLVATARRCYRALSGPGRRWVAAYAEGVNEGLPAAWASSVEAQHTRHEPLPWDPWTPILALLHHHLLFSRCASQLWFDQAAQRVPNEVLRALTLDAAAPESGSNAWAVTGSHTHTGAPLLAADPHRVLEWPGLYQQIHLVCPEFDVIGLALVGVPGTPHFGHNGDVAWAVTNAMADSHRLIRESLSGDRRTARGPHGPEPTILRTAHITVRGRRTPLSVDVVRTRRGPVILHDDAEMYSLHHPADSWGQCGLDTVLPLMGSRTAPTAMAAWEPWVDPTHRVIVADRHGAVLEGLAGRPPHDGGAPDRIPCAWHLAPQRPPAWLGAPRTVTDLVVHANQRRRGEELGREYCPPDRAHRIATLVAEREHHTVESFAAIQHDTVLLGADPLLRVVAALPSSPATDPVRGVLLSWDRRMDAASHGAALFARLRHRVVDSLRTDPLLATLSTITAPTPVVAPWMSTTSRLGLSLNALIDPRTSPLHQPTRHVVRALHAMAAEVSPTLRWGDTHTPMALHEASGCPWFADDPAVKQVRHRLDHGLAGDTDCVLACGSSPGVTDGALRVPVAQLVWDLHDRDTSRWVVALGAHGDPASPHHCDQFPHWAAGMLLPVPRLSPLGDHRVHHSAA